VPAAASKSIFALLALAALLPACPSRCGLESAATGDAGTTPSAAVAGSPPLPLPPNAIAVPLVRQSENFSCGDVATLAILRYWDPADYASVQESALYAPLHTSTEDGTDPAPIASYFTSVPSHTLSAEFRLHVTLDDLTTAIDRGEPPIVDFQAWKDEPRSPPEAEWAADWDDGHYAVLVGYDDRELYFMDPSTSDHYAYVPKSEFVARWHDTLTGSNEHIEHAVIFVHSTARIAPHVPDVRDATPLL
jgi:predicted double-glycine peptidase